MTTAAPEFKPAIEISLDALAHNLGIIRASCAPGTKIMAVVKDAAYGCGAIPVTRVLEQEGVDFCAVAHAVEARALRRAGIRVPVLVLGESSADDLAWGARRRVSFSLNDVAVLKRWRSWDVPVRFHCNVDTGMGRLGILPAEIGRVLTAARRCSRLRFEGIYTHYASADLMQRRTVGRQRRLFAEVARRVRGAGFSPEYLHCANSAASLLFEDETTNMARPGIALYGCSPVPGHPCGRKLKQVVTLWAPIMKIKRVPPGTAVSYGGTYRTRRSTRIATIPLGYAHGYPRILGNRGRVLIRGRRHRIAGRVTMDYIMVDLGSAPASVGDRAVVLGTQKKQAITPADLARASHTITYEILCGLSPTVDRLYFYRGTRTGPIPGCRY